MRATLFILAMVAVLSFTVTACHDDNSNNNSGDTFTEDQFVADPNLKANPETDLIIKFLEPPPTKVILANTKDTGDLGIDEITFSYTRTQEHTICIDDDPIAAHTFELEGTGIETLTLTMGECMQAVIPSGDYILRSIHDGLSDKTHTVFVIPNADKIIEASNKDTFLYKAKSFADRALNFITNKAVEDAHAQTSSLQTLITTRSCIGCDLRGVDLSFRDLEGVDLTGANLKNATLQGSDVDIAELTSARLIGTNLTNATFTDSDFSVAKIDDTTILTGARFSNALWLDGQCMCEVFNPTPLESLTAGNSPSAVTHHPVNSTLYVANLDDNTVSVLDPSANVMLADPIDVGPLPVDVELSPNGSLLYVVNSNQDGLGVTIGSISVVNTSTNQVTATIPAGHNPSSAAVTPDGRTLYVANSDNEVLIIDTILNRVIGSIDGLTASFLAINPDGSKLYVTNLIASNVAVVDTSTNMIIDSIKVGDGPAEAAVSVKNTLYVANARDNTVSIINAISDQVITTINVGLLPRSIDITPDGSFVFVTNSAGSSVVIIDTFTNSVIGQVALQSGSQPNSVVVSPDATRVYVANNGANNVAVIELLSVGECSGCSQ